MLQTRLSTLQRLRPSYQCSLALARPQSKPQSWRLNGTSGRPTQAFATSSKDTTTTTTTTTATEDTPDKAPDKSLPPPAKLGRRGRKDLSRAKLNQVLKDPSPVSPGLAEKLLLSLSHLEQSYADLNKRLDQSASAERSQDPKTDDGKDDAPKAAALAENAKIKLESRINTVSKTLEVLKNVLASQPIPIDDLRKKTKQDSVAKRPLAPKKGVVERSGHLKPASSPKKKASSSVKAKKADKPQPEAPAPGTKATATSPVAIPSTMAAYLTSYSQPATASSPASASASASPPAEATKELDTVIQTSSSLATQVRRLGRRGTKPIRVRTVAAKKLELTPVDMPDMPPVPTLSYGLERALFNPGVVQLQDPRSKVFNFDPYLSKIMPLNEFDFSALQQYITSSKDDTLYELASKLGKKYSGSTSSMTSLLAHFHYLISAWRPINTSNLSGNIKPDYKTFTRINRAPAATFLHVRDGIYAIDADKEYDTANILSMLGKSMEKLLTLDKEAFERYRHKNSDQISEEERNASEAYHFSTMGDFLMRSQLDATDKRLPGTGMFDLKTRAVVSIRMDAGGFQKGLGYEIRRRFGEWESFEREYYDMIRSAFIKYSLQVRMGRMDGIFVAFHNTQRIFGFQYIPIEEMDRSIHGSLTRHHGDLEFKLSLHLLNKALDRATARFPGRALRLHVETRPGNPPFMYIFAKPVTKQEINKVQNASKAAVAQFERKWLGYQQVEVETEEPEPSKDQQQLQEDDSAEAAEDAKQSTLAFWEEMQDRVEEAVEDDARGISHVRESIQDALEQSGLLEAKSPDEARVYVEALLDALVRSADYEVDNVLGRVAVKQTGKTGNGVAAKPTATLAAAETTDPSTLDAEEANAKVPDLGLKDLILKIAEQVDEKPEEADAQASEEDVTDVSRLRDFERILSELVSTSRKEDGDVPTTTEEAEEPMSIDFDHSWWAGNNEDGAASDETATSNTNPELDDTLSVKDDEILGMHLTIRNKVNGRYVERAENIDSGSSWLLEYSFEEIPPESAKKIYASMQARRRKTLDTGDAESRAKTWLQMWRGKLKRMSDSGRDRRRNEDAKARQRPVHVLGLDEPLTYDNAFSHHAEWVDTTSNKK